MEVDGTHCYTMYGTGFETGGTATEGLRTARCGGQHRSPVTRGCWPVSLFDSHSGRPTSCACYKKQLKLITFLCDFLCEHKSSKCLEPFTIYLLILTMGVLTIQLEKYGRFSKQKVEHTVLIYLPGKIEAFFGLTILHINY